MSSSHPSKREQDFGHALRGTQCLHGQGVPWRWALRSVRSACGQGLCVCWAPRGQQEPSARLSSFKAALGFLPATLRKAPHSFWHISTLLLLFLSPSLPSHADAALTNIARLLYQGIDQKSLPTRKPSLLASTRLPALGPACQA